MVKTNAKGHVRAPKGHWKEDRENTLSEIHVYVYTYCIVCAALGLLGVHWPDEFDQMFWQHCASPFISV